MPDTASPAAAVLYDEFQTNDNVVEQRAATTTIGGRMDQQYIMALSKMAKAVKMDADCAQLRSAGPNRDGVRSARCVKAYLAAFLKLLHQK